MTGFVTLQDALKDIREQCVELARKTYSSLVSINSACAHNAGLCTSVQTSVRTSHECACLHACVYVCACVCVCSQLPGWAPDWIRKELPRIEFLDEIQLREKLRKQDEARLKRAQDRLRAAQQGMAGSAGAAGAGAASQVDLCASQSAGALGAAGGVSKAGGATEEMQEAPGGVASVPGTPPTEIIDLCDSQPQGENNNDDAPTSALKALAAAPTTNPTSPGVKSSGGDVSVETGPDASAAAAGSAGRSGACDVAALAASAAMALAAAAAAAPASTGALGGESGDVMIAEGGDNAPADKDRGGVEYSVAERNAERLLDYVRQLNSASKWSGVQVCCTTCTYTIHSTGCDTLPCLYHEEYNIYQ